MWTGAVMTSERILLVPEICLDKAFEACSR